MPAASRSCSRPEKDAVQTVNHDAEPGGSFDPDHAVGDVSPADFAGLVLPGGVANPDKLRLVPEAVAFVKAFAAAGKPIAAICHGPWTLVEAGLVAGKTLTSWPSLQTDIRNAGGDWRDEQVVLSPEQGFDLVTSRKPDDLDAFDKQLVKSFAQTVWSRQPRFSRPRRVACPIRLSASRASKSPGPA